MTLLVEVPTPLGPGRWHIDAADEPAATLLLGHGAGGGVTATDLDLLARKLPAGGVTVMRFEQPWRLAGRKVATPPPQLDIGWRAGVDALAADGLLTDALFFGGRSAGARVACRTAPDYQVAGVVCLAFPLHLPGRPEKSRAAELLTPTVPRLVVQGTKDSFGTAEEIRAAAGPDAGVILVELPGADHGYRLAKASRFTPADLRTRLVEVVSGFMQGLADGMPTASRSFGEQPPRSGPVRSGEIDGKEGPVATADDLRWMALSLPRTTEHLVRGRWKFRVGAIVYASLSEDETIMGCGFPKEERTDAIAAEPEKFAMPSVADQRFNWIHVRLAAVDRAELVELVVDAWRMVVPRYVVREHLGDPPNLERAIRAADRHALDAADRPVPQADRREVDPSE